MVLTQIDFEESIGAHTWEKHTCLFVATVSLICSMNASTHTIESWTTLAWASALQTGCNFHSICLSTLRLYFSCILFWLTESHIDMSAMTLAQWSVQMLFVVNRVLNRVRLVMPLNARYICICLRITMSASNDTIEPWTTAAWASTASSIRQSRTKSCYQSSDMKAFLSWFVSSKALLSILGHEMTFENNRLSLRKLRTIHDANSAHVYPHNR